MWRAHENPQPALVLILALWKASKLIRGVISAQKPPFDLMLVFHKNDCKLGNGLSQKWITKLLKKFFFDCLNNIYKKAKKQSPFATALPPSPLLSVPPGNSWAYSKSTFLTWKDLVPPSRQPVPWDGVCSSEKVLRFSWTAVTEQQQPGFPQVCDNRIPSLIPRMCLETGMFTVLPQELFRVSISLPWPLCKQLDHCSWL